ncbi:basic helix-loop-helix (bHLH) DNA-binding superfamily protein [Actinidia rufa]|uniref:Basic helix-loop-helix (BHLH) DNA-binding superfamily protein n=1 Tax=Actinidia rufa TaxID=165716 RepID=A0A7J0E603_9ERIC|nr:basic helix-loop-helix (bHLH) DNA-binding superfamily protein [Actinidia rufa]
MKPRIGESSGENSNQIGDYTLHNPDKLMSFADVMQFADFGPKLGLNPNRISEEEDEAGIDPVYFLRFPVLNDKLEGGENPDWRSSIHNWRSHRVCKRAREQLQCLESQKRRRLYGDLPPPPQPVVAGDSSSLAIPQPLPQPFYSPVPIPNDQLRVLDFETGLREEMAESKSCLADVEVKMLGFDVMIKILSRRRPGQLIIRP